MTALVRMVCLSRQHIGCRQRVTQMAAAVCLRVVLKYFDCDTFYGLVLLLELFLL